MSNNTNILTKVVVLCRLSYANIWEPKSINGSEPKYSVCAIIPKSDKAAVSKIKAAIAQAEMKSVKKWGGRIPENLANPLKDGDIEMPENEAFADSWFINAVSNTAPQIVDKKVQPIVNHEEVYSGCYGKISINFYGYNVDGNMGIGAGLGNIQKLRDGESLSTRSSAEDDFDIVEDDTESFLY